MTASQRRLEVHDGLWSGRSRDQIARILKVPVRTVVRDILMLRLDGVRLPGKGDARVDAA